MKLQLRSKKGFIKGRVLVLALALLGVTVAASLAPAGVAQAAYQYKSTMVYSADIHRIGVGLYESDPLWTPTSRATYDCGSSYNNIYIDRDGINGFGDATSQANFRVKYYPTNGTPFRDSLGWEFITRHNTAPHWVIGTCVIPGTKFTIETDRRMDYYRVHY
jgi:hypothetical protein